MSADLLRTLLLRAGIESNPGPCDSCGKIPSKPFRCKADDCEKVTHRMQECSGLNRDGQRAGEWFCNIHQPDCTNDPNSAALQPNRTGPTYGKCDSCNKYVQKNHLKCDTADCKAVCHKKTDCSGGHNYKACSGVLWRCSTHSSMNQQDADGAIPELEEAVVALGELCGKCNTKCTSKTLLVCNMCRLPRHDKEDCSRIKNRYEVKRMKKKGNWICPSCTGDEQPPNEPASDPEVSPPKKCCSCTKTINTRYRHLTCCRCKAASHQKCQEDLTRDAVEKFMKTNSWICKQCLTEKEDDPIPGTEEVQDTPEPKGRGGLKRPLRVLQWNADGLNTKIPELRTFLQDHEIDIAMIQESKLTPTKETPKIQGYISLRADRKYAEYPGGGLITYIMDNLAYKSHGRTQRGIVETQSFSIQQSASKWLKFTNVYIPPKAEADISWIPIPTRGVIAGDLNGHSRLWDETQPADKRGEAILDYILLNDLAFLNDGTGTRINKDSLVESSPDVTLVNQTLEDKCKWTVMEDIGSDHLPIVTQIDDGTTRLVNRMGRKARWKKNDVNWKAFAEEVESNMKQTDPNKSLKVRVAEFTATLIAAGYNHIGKTMPKRSKVYMSPAIRTLVKKRNRLRRNVKEHREEWIAAVEETRDAIVESQRERWVDYVTDLESDGDPAKVWRVIRSLDGSPDTPSPNEALRHNNKDVTSDYKKADIFGQHYASVNKLTFDKDERDRNRACKQRVNSPSVDNESCSKFSISELKDAIKRMRKRGAPGPDDIPPSFIQNLGPTALETLLGLFNDSFFKGMVPQVWKLANIIPILKSGKPASRLDSFRPISLTSCVGKTLERMINNRLYSLAENNGWISNRQAGFRKGRSCEDQILRFTQNISDGFQESPARRTVMLLLDYSKAYDRVWCQDLILSMSEKGVPGTMLRWINNFLENRIARVEVNGCQGKKAHMKQGLPQGSVLSPLLFLFFINEFAELLPDHTDCALFADDASLWTSNCSLDTAQDNLQESVKIIEEWSKKKKLIINTDKGKTESTFFTTDPAEAIFKPEIKLLGKDIHYNPNPKFLGIELDRTLSFQKHIKTVTGKVVGKCKMLAALSTKTWGWQKKNMRSVYITAVRSIMDYAAPAWQPFCSKTQLQHLDVAQNKALRIVNGQHASTRCEAIRAESGLPSYQTISKQLTALSYEKATRLQPSHPKRESLDKKVKHRIKSKSSWREKATNLVNNLPLCQLEREPINEVIETPWLRMPLQQSTIDTEAYKTDVLKHITTSVNEFHPDFTIYTDGSCSGGTTNGGAAAVITTGPADNPVEVETRLEKGSNFTCSYDEEKRAMFLAGNWMRDNPMAKRVAVCTDSLSLLQALQNQSPDTEELKTSLNQLEDTSMLLKWVPGHANIPGNELADAAAKEAAQLENSGIGKPITIGAAKSCIKRMICEPEIPDEPEFSYIKSAYSQVSQKRDQDANLSRKDAATLAQLRAGHCIKLAAYKARIDKTRSPTCPRCELEDETAQHWLMRCPAHALARQTILGFEPNLDAQILGSHPYEAALFARRTLKDPPRQDAV